MNLDQYIHNPAQLIAEHLILDSGLTYGACMAGFQQAFFEAVFARRDGKPRYRLIYDERRRGEAKTEDMAAAALADLLTGPPRHRSFCVAASRQQAEILLDSVSGFRSRSSVLAEVDIQHNLVRNEATGSELRVLSSEDRPSYGIRPRKVFHDELSLQTDERLWTSLFSAVGKSAQSQMIAVSMAGNDFSSLAWRIRELARSSDHYYFHSRQGTELAPWLSKENMEEQRLVLHPAEFASLWECRWSEPAGAWITFEMYQDAEKGEEAYSRDDKTKQYGFVDIGLTHDPTTVAIVHEAGEVVILDSLSTLQGTKTEPVQLKVLEGLITDLTCRFNVVKWRIESPQGAATAQELADRLPAVVELQHPTVKTQGDLWGNLWRLFRAHRIVVYPHDRLKQETLSLVTKTVGGVIKTVESSRIHQDHILAVGGAAQLLEQEKAGNFAVIFAGDDESRKLGLSPWAEHDSDGDEAWPDSLNSGPLILQ